MSKSWLPRRIVAILEDGREATDELAEMLAGEPAVARRALGLIGGDQLSLPSAP
jgi:hypothetical protein